ncbi:hypothetical protein MSPP1_001364 [Malassezia sp. CBS 17886]|nr:hypothetical protein MSPP1_001364 [Malassezia sp. CBS 17886]
MTPSLQVVGKDSFAQFTHEADQEVLIQNWRMLGRLQHSMSQAQRLKNASWRLWHRRHDAVNQYGSNNAMDTSQVPNCVPHQYHANVNAPPMNANVPPDGMYFSMDALYMTGWAPSRSSNLHSALSDTPPPMEQHISPGVLQLFPPPPVSDTACRLDGCSYTGNENFALREALGIPPQQVSAMPTHDPEPLAATTNQGR